MRAFPWQPPTFLAPMEGITSPPVRELIAARGGVGVVCTEFVRITNNPLGKKTLLKHVRRPSRGALSVQVMGNLVEQMAEATALVTDAGADIVDINLGCPAPRAVRKGVGAAMLEDLALLGRVIEAMRERTSLPLSAKIRAGVDDTSRVLDVARTVQEAGADFITVHPRRRVDYYEGVADWRIVTNLVNALSIPVVGNGDLWYAADALRLQTETGCAAVMMGRPVLRNPWLFMQIDALRRGVKPPRPTGADVVEYVDQLLDVFTRAYPARGQVGLLKEQLRYIGRLLDDGGDFVRRVLRAQELDAMRRIVSEVFETLSFAELDLAAEGGRRESCPRAATGA